MRGRDDVIEHNRYKFVTDPYTHLTIDVNRNLLAIHGANYFEELKVKVIEDGFNFDTVYIDDWSRFDYNEIRVVFERKNK